MNNRMCEPVHFLCVAELRTIGFNYITIPAEPLNAGMMKIPVEFSQTTVL